MALEARRTNLELATLRIERPQEQPRRKRSRSVSMAILLLLTAVLGAASYVTYAKTLGRPQTVQTIMVVSNGAGQPGVMLTGSGYVVTRHKYITIGTKILGQIVAEPIEEGQHVRIGDLVAQIDDRDYQAQRGRTMKGCQSGRRKTAPLILLLLSFLAAGASSVNGG